MKRMCALLALAVLLTGCAFGNGGENGDFGSTSATQSMSGAFPGLGGLMPEMTVTSTEGEELVLSELLEEKKLVVLNFWFADCVWCRKEFPAMEQAYQQYQEDVEIIALNPMDPAEAIEVFRKSGSLTFPMVTCPRTWAVEMGITGYPTSVFIDRDGVVCLIHAGAITESDDFAQIFETFTADDYQRRIYRSVEDLLS